MQTVVLTSDQPLKDTDDPTQKAVLKVQFYTIRFGGQEEKVLPYAYFTERVAIGSSQLGRWFNSNWRM